MTVNVAEVFVHQLELDRDLFTEPEPRVLYFIEDVDGRAVKIIEVWSEYAPRVLSSWELVSLPNPTTGALMPRLRRIDE